MKKIIILGNDENGKLITHNYRQTKINMKKQTAVEYLHSEYKKILGDVLVKPSQAMEIADALEKAKKLEKQQIIDSFNNGISNWDNTDDYNGEQYYNENYGK